MTLTKTCCGSFTGSILERGKDTGAAKTSSFCPLNTHGPSKIHKSHNKYSLVYLSSCTNDNIYTISQKGFIQTAVRGADNSCSKITGK